jgi:hypothetical protein
MMKRQHADDEALLVDTFASDWNTGRPAALARQAAAGVRRRRTARRALTIASLFIILAAVGIMTRRSHISAPAERVPALVASAPVPAAVPLPLRGYEIISDDELLAVVRDLPVLAVRQPDGQRRVVVLKMPPESEPLE